MSRSSSLATYTHVRPFLLVSGIVIGGVAAASLSDRLHAYQVLGWASVIIFGWWSFVVVRYGAAILTQQPKSAFFLTFQMALTGLKFLLLIIILLFYGKFAAPPDHDFAWYLLITFLPYFIYETWAFSGMSKAV